LEHIELLNNKKCTIMKWKFVLLFALMAAVSGCENADYGGYTVVTDENYALAESQVIFANYRDRIVAKSGGSGTGTFLHSRTSADPNDKTVMRINFDTRYSMCLLDLNCEATLTMPETNGRYQSAWFVTEDHYNPMAINHPGTYTITKEDMGSRYVLLMIRTQVNMKDEADMAIVTTLQDALKIEQADKGSYNPVEKWRMEDILSMRQKYLKIANEKHYTSEQLFGRKGELTQEAHNCGVAYGWGGFTPDQAVYLSCIPANDKPCTLTLVDVPVADNAFWSITVYDAQGYPQGDPYNVNSAFAVGNSDGSVTIHFGGEDKSVANYLEIFPGWTYILRLYLPQEPYFNGSWQQPKLQYAE
jgi:hypothetical protein